MKILAQYDHSGPKFHRVLMPLHMMPGIDFAITGKLTDDQLKGVDILFVNRMCTGVSLNNLLNAKKAYGFKLIVDMDDHWILDPSHLLYHQYQQMNTSDIIAAYIKEADAVIVTNERLYTEVFRLNNNVHILPNAIPKYDQFLFKKQPDKKTRLFWAGGVTHAKDLELLRNPVRRISQDSRVKFVLGGYSAKQPEFLKMASAFTNGGKACHELLEALPVNQYYAAYSKCDISLIPLVDNTFNQYKSNLKILEAANIEAPVVVSYCHPYIGFPEKYVNYVINQKYWYKCVMWLLDNPEAAREQGHYLSTYCDQLYNFNDINKHRLEIFKHVHAR